MDSGTLMGSQDISPASASYPLHVMNGWKEKKKKKEINSHW